MRRTALAVLAIVVVALGALAIGRAEASPPAHGGVVAAAARGDARAQTRLGSMYERGIGVPQNYEQAAFWYHCAAERGDPRAQYHLGVLLNKGFGVPRDFMLSYKWLNLAAARVGGAERAYYVRIRDAVATKLNRLEIAEAQWWALQWRPAR